MRLGNAAKAMGVDTETISRWIASYGDFFTSAARGQDSAQREITEADLIVLNTIRHMRRERLGSDGIWDKLNEGFRVAELPAAAAGIDLGLTTVNAYANTLAIQRQLDEARAIIQKLQQQIQDTQKADAAEKERLMTQWRRETESLYEKIGKYKAMLRQAGIDLGD